MLLLSSLERLKRFVCVDLDSKNTSRLAGYLYAVSSNIQAYINNDLELKTHIQFYDIFGNEIEFWTRSIPITSITEIAHDFEGLYDGGESLLTDFHTGSDDRSVVLDFPETPGKKSLRVTYVGGAASTATLSTYTLTGVTGSFVTGDFVRNTNLNARGIIKSFLSDVLVVDVLYGVFNVDDVLTMQATEDGGDIGGIGGTILTVDVRSLVEARPDIAMACDIQVAYNFRTFNNFESINIKKNQTNRRQIQNIHSNMNTYVDLQPEVRSMLQKYRRFLIA